MCLHLNETFDADMDKEFEETYGTLIEGIDAEEETENKQFYSVFLIRRVTYSLIIIGLYGYPYTQLFMIIFVAILPVFVQYLFMSRGLYICSCIDHLRVCQVICSIYSMNQSFF